MSYEEFTNSGKQDAMRLEVSKIGIDVPKGSERQQMYADVTLRARVFRTAAQSRKFDPMMPSTEPMVFENDVGVLLASRPLEEDDHLMIRLRHCDVFGDKDIGSVKVFLNELHLLYDDPLQVRAGPFFFTLRAQNFGSLPPDGHVFGSSPTFEYKATVGPAAGGKKPKKKKKSKKTYTEVPAVTMDALIGDGDGASDQAPPAAVAPPLPAQQVENCAPPGAAEEDQPNTGVPKGTPNWGTRGPKPYQDVGGPPVGDGATIQQFMVEDDPPPPPHMQPNVVRSPQQEAPTTMVETLPPVQGEVSRGQGEVSRGLPADPPPASYTALTQQQQQQQPEFDPVTKTAPAPVPAQPAPVQPPSASGQQAAYAPPPPASQPFRTQAQQEYDQQQQRELQEQVVGGYQLNDEDEEEDDPSACPRGEVGGFGVAPLVGMPDSIPTTGVATDGSLTSSAGVPHGQMPVPGSIVHNDGGPGAVLQIHRATSIQEQLFWDGTIAPVPPYGTYAQVKQSLAQRAVAAQSAPSEDHDAASRFIGAVLKTVKTGAAKLEQGVEDALFRKNFPEQSPEIKLLETFRPAMLNGTGTPIDGTLFITNAGLFFDGPLMHFGVGWAQIVHYRRSTSMGDDAIQIFTADHKVWQLQQFDGAMARVGMLVGTRTQSKFMEALHLMGFQWWTVMNARAPEV